MKEMKERIALLNKASKSYYQEDRQIISDYEYDALYDELVEWEKETGTVYANSPTRNVGYTVLSNLEKVKHDSKILSLDKTKQVSKLKSWLGQQEGILSWKLDGLTIVLKYKEGHMIQAITRGNGEIGEDITHNAKVFRNIPLEIPYQGELVLRGEGIISYSSFHRINETLPEGEVYKNPRNLCSGTVRQLNSEVVAKREVDFLAFGVVNSVNVNFYDEKQNQLDWLKQQGFAVVEHQIVTKDTLENMVSLFAKKISENDFASDGLVLTFNVISFSERLGQTAKFPKDSIAFKWRDEMAETTLREVEWNTSRTGLMNPVAVFDPVELEGSTVNRASVHNVSILEELHLGIGDTIKVYKANMIIPQIAENLTCSGNVAIPLQCVVCGGETEIRSLKEGRTLYCTNPSCKAQQLQSLSHFVSRDAMNVEGFSEETLRKLIEKGFIVQYPDIFTLEKYGDTIKTMEGFGEKSYENLMNAIEKAKNVSLFNFIYALGINQIGLSNAKLLCKTFEYDLNKIRTATEEELIAIDGFGSIIAHSISSYFQSEEHITLLERVLPFLQFTLVSQLQNVENTLEGKSFVVTGDLELFQNRKALQLMIEEQGGKVTGSVTGKTICLINNDIESASSKNRKAKELGIPILTEKEFIEGYLKGLL